MKLKNNELNLKKGIKKEWIITNGIGGYASSTSIGINTRKYHGLLVAALNPPAKRFLVLSKVDESLEIDKVKYNLYSNMCTDYISDGYKYMTEFEKDYIPVFRYNVRGVQIEKSICMVHGKNTVIILYHIISEKNAKLTLAPLINFRDFHTINSGHKYELNQTSEDNKVKIIVDGETKNPIYMNLSEGKYIEHQSDRFNNMYYIEEENRGFHPEENHAVPGRYEVLIKEGKEQYITFSCSLHSEPIEYDGRQVIKNEIDRLYGEINKISLNINKNLEIPKSEELIKKYVIASDNFIVYRPAFKLHTLIAGYPWFLDWGRDSLISYEGIALMSGRYKLAREILLTLIQSEENGLIPNGYSGFNNKPLYNSVDSSLLLFEQVKKYLKYTDDYKFVRAKIYPKLLKIIVLYRKGIDIDNNNIFVDTDYLLSSGTKQTQNTWMDAKIGDKAVTPRNGKAVEINAMWYNALKIAQELATKFENEEFAKKCASLARKCKKSFEEQFYNEDKKTLYDVLGDDKIRPNQLFTLSLSYPILEAENPISKIVFNTVTKKLLNDYGLKTLAKGEEKYTEIYEGNEIKRDMSYHQGITWPWLLGIYMDAFEKIIQAEKDEKNKKLLSDAHSKLIARIEKTFINEMENGNSIGSISELFDSKKPFGSNGAFAQCWSVAEIFRILLK